MTEKRKRDDGDGAAASKKPKRDKSKYSKNVDPSKSKAERKADRKVAKAARKAQNELKVENKAAVNVNGTDAPIEDSATREATDSSADIEAPAASTVEEPKKKKSKKDKSKPKKAGEDGAAFAIDTKGDASIAADAGVVMNGMTEAITPVEVKKEKKSKKRKAEAEEAQPESVVEKPVKKEKSSKHKGEAKATDSDSALPYTEHPALAKLPQSEITEFLESKQITTKDAETERRPIISFDYLPSLNGSANPFEGFKAPTPIQATTWPYLLAGQDVIGVAETGSGKTLAFGVPCVHRLLREKSKHIRACIVSPTRELALQIQEQLAKLSSSYGLKVTCVYGGVDKDTQRRALAGTSIVVATPGRLNDFVQEGSIDLSHVDYLVLDEADRMLDKGFEDDIRKIASSTAQTGRQTLMFTATWPESIRNLAATFMIKPVRILIGNATGELRANTRIVQEVEVVEPREKQNRLFQLLKQYQSGKNKNDRILVFCLYKKEATRIEEFIRYKGFNVAGIHGDLGQLKRQESLEAFKNGSVPLLVATDVAARGLDIPAVKLVINVTFPLTAEDYVHRIGRTGRAGQDGRAITMFTEEDKALSGALINVLKAAGQPVPEELMKFGTTVKKKSHDAYGAFYKDPADMKKATKITFD